MGVYIIYIEGRWAVYTIMGSQKRKIKRKKTDTKNTYHILQRGQFHVTMTHDDA